MVNTVKMIITTIGGWKSAFALLRPSASTSIMLATLIILVALFPHEKWEWGNTQAPPLAPAVAPHSPPPVEEEPVPEAPVTAEETPSTTDSSVVDTVPTEENSVEPTVSNVPGNTPGTHSYPNNRNPSTIPSTGISPSVSTPPQGGYSPPQGGYSPPQGGYSPPQGGYSPPQGGYSPPSHSLPQGGNGGQGESLKPLESQ